MKKKQYSYCLTWIANIHKKHHHNNKGCSIKTYEVPGEGTLIFGQPPKEAIY